MWLVFGVQSSMNEIFGVPEPESVAVSDPHPPIGAISAAAANAAAAERMMVCNA